MISRDKPSWIPNEWASISILFDNRILKTRQLFLYVLILACSNVQCKVFFLQWCRLVLMMLFRFGVSCFVLQTYPSWFGRCVLTTDKSSVSILSSINLKIQECTSWQIIIMYSLSLSLYHFLYDTMTRILFQRWLYMFNRQQ